MGGQAREGGSSQVFIVRKIPRYPCYSCHGWSGFRRWMRERWWWGLRRRRGGGKGKRNAHSADKLAEGEGDDGRLGDDDES